MPRRDIDADVITTPDVGPARWELCAWLTLADDGVGVLRHARLGELRRDEPFGGDFRARRLAWVSGTDHPGWEARGAVAKRFDEAVRDHLSRAGGIPLVVATHGMAMTAWLTWLGAVDDAGAFRSGLGFPHLVEVDLESPRVSTR